MLRRPATLKKIGDHIADNVSLRSGYVVDHVVPLKLGGSDTPSNMQWQTKEAAKAKDKRE